MYKCFTMGMILLLLLSVDQTIAQTEVYTNSGEYYFGIGIAASQPEAQKMALRHLTEQISIHVESLFERAVNENDSLFSDRVASSVKTYSQATLQNVNFENSIKPNGDVKVFAYMARSEVEKTFQERREMIVSMCREAEKLTARQDIAGALKLYYYGMILLKSLPELSLVMDEVNYTLELPGRLEGLLSQCRFDWVEDTQKSANIREIRLKVLHEGQPVSRLDFAFWDGKNKVDVEARDGVAVLQLYGGSMSFDALTVWISYEYYHARNQFAPVAVLWDAVTRPRFASVRKIPLEADDEDSSEPEQSEPEYASGVRVEQFDVHLRDVANSGVTEQIAEEIDILAGLLSPEKTAEITRHYTDDAFIRNKLMKYVQLNHPVVTSPEIRGEISQTRDGYEFRRLQVLHHYPSIHKQSTDFLVLDFSQDGKLIDVNTSVNSRIYQSYVAASRDSAKRQEKLTTLKFLEKYRTAFLTRDLDTIDLIFDEQALILVGRTIQKKPYHEIGDQYVKFGNNPDYKTIRLDKQGYLKRLKGVFASQADISLEFGSFDLVKKNNQKIYGVQMRQNYASTGYGDEGHLFLMLDFEPTDPVILVRAWQPNAWKNDRLVEMANFPVRRAVDSLETKIRNQN